MFNILKIKLNWLSYLFFFLIFKYVYATETVNIFIKTPDFIENNNIKEWKDDYQILINEQFKEINKKKGNTLLQDVEIEFKFSDDYIEAIEIDRDDYLTFPYYEYVNRTLNDGIWERQADIIIMDERLLFNDKALMETDLLFFRLIFDEDLVNFSEVFKINKISDYINNEKINYHHPTVIKDGSYDNNLLGLPYEIDFDLLYYNEQMIENNIISSMVNLTWDDLLEYLHKTSQSVNFPLYDDDDLL
eukprot:jgi/Orpsp1_1/1187826/evm.model.d7180000060420.1